MCQKLLGSRDLPPVLVAKFGEASPWLLTADHAGNAVPVGLGDLGLSAADLDDHIGVDIGIWPLTRRIAERLGAMAIGQAYSRLVIDCNRRPGTRASVPVISDGRAIPGNIGADPRPRIDEIFLPYHEAIKAQLERQTVIGAMHSFTRVLGGNRRAVDIGVIYGPRTRLADVVFEGLVGCGLKVERNKPYRIDFSGDYTLPVHAEARGADYVELEICQDLIGDPVGQLRLAEIVAPALAAAQLSLS